jgi:hypothetical protein
MLAALLLLTLGHDAVARGGLQRLERYADQVELAVDPGRSNLLSDGAVAALRRWPALVWVELRLPVGPREAAQLRRLGRFGARLAVGPAAGPAAPRALQPSLRLLEPALVRFAPAGARTRAQGPCPGTELAQQEGEPVELRVQAPLDECVYRWIAGQLELRPEGAGEPPVGQGGGPAPK